MQSSMASQWLGCWRLCVETWRDWYSAGCVRHSCPTRWPAPPASPHPPASPRPYCLTLPIGWLKACNKNLVLVRKAHLAPAFFPPAPPPQSPQPLRGVKRARAAGLMGNRGGGEARLTLWRLHGDLKGLGAIGWKDEVARGEAGGGVGGGG